MTDDDGDWDIHKTSPIITVEQASCLFKTTFFGDVYKLFAILQFFNQKSKFPSVAGSGRDRAIPCPYESRVL
jgi:hypothetical protein